MRRSERLIRMRRHINTSHNSPRLTRLFASLLPVALSRLAFAARSLRVYFSRQWSDAADAQLLARADYWKASHPTLTRALRSYVRGGSSY